MNVSVRILVSILVASSSAAAEDWPMFRHDAARSGNAAAALAETLELEWTLELEPPRSAWPVEQDRLQFDAHYEPIVVGDSLFLASMNADFVECFELESGRSRWRTYLDGPPRFAPAVADGRVFVACDDGYLYCLGEDDGSVRWRIRGGPADRCLLGNGRLIGAWPVRGAPVVRDGVVYFGASIWPFMGIFLHAVDAETGRVVWTNDGSGSEFIVQQHRSRAFAGVAPQGYIAANDRHLAVAGGRTVPAVYDRKTGEFINYDVGSREMGRKGGSGYEVFVGENFFVASGDLYKISDGTFVESIAGEILAPEAIIGRTSKGIEGFRPRWEPARRRGRRGGRSDKPDVRSAWTATIDPAIRRILLKAGPRIYCAGDGHRIFAVDLPRLAAGAKVSWSVDLPDEPRSAIAAHGRLLVSTAEGRIYCFGERSTGAELPPSRVVELVPRGSRWDAFFSGVTPDADWTSPDSPADGWKDPDNPEGRAAPIGYGDSQIETEFVFRGARPVTVYFRRDFEVADASSQFDVLRARILVDDGCIVYLNGTEAGRLFMPGGDVTSDTLAQSGTDETTYVELELPQGLLRAGRNRLAVEVHQVKADSSDLIFDLELSGVRSRPRPSWRPGGSEWSSHAKGALASADRGGFAFVVGLGTGGLVDQLVERSDLHVIVAEPDPALADAFRRRMTAAELYGRRVALIARDWRELELPPYFASLITSETVTAADLANDQDAVRRLLGVQRPYDGRLVLAGSAADAARLGDIASSVLPGGVEASATDDLVQLLRTGGPPGAANWSHQYASAANTAASDDTAVRAPLGLLWFGGSSHRGVLPRHGHGPTPQVSEGRLFIEGRDFLRAMDIYTGRVLWERVLEGVGEPYDSTKHQPGANAVGSNYVSLPTGVYVVHRDVCLELDPATGSTRREFRIPGSGDGEKSADWGYLTIEGNTLVAGSNVVGNEGIEYTAQEMIDLSGRDLRYAVWSMGALLDFEPIGYEEAKGFVRGALEVEDEYLDDDEAPSDSGRNDGGGGSGWREWVAQYNRRSNEAHRAYLVANANKLLLDAKMLRRIPARVYYKAKADTPGAKYWKYLDEDAARTPLDDEALIIKRQILERCYGLPKYEARPAGAFASTAKTASRRLYALDLSDGSIRWSQSAAYQMRHNAIAVGPRSVFAIDAMSSEEVSYQRRRGQPDNENASVVAYDLETGNPRWRDGERVFGTWLSYSASHDVVVQAGARASDRARDEVGSGIVALRGADGEFLWEHRGKVQWPVHPARGPFDHAGIPHSRVRARSSNGRADPVTARTQRGTGELELHSWVRLQHRDRLPESPHVSFRGRRLLRPDDERGHRQPGRLSRGLYVKSHPGRRRRDGARLYSDVQLRVPEPDVARAHPHTGGRDVDVLFARVGRTSRRARRPQFRCARRSTRADRYPLARLAERRGHVARHSREPIQRRSGLSVSASARVDPGGGRPRVRRGVGARGRG